MISIKIKDTNKFMQSILVKDIFDPFLISEVTINTFNAFSIDGHINKNFYSDDEFNALPEHFSSWSEIKHICFEIIRGKKVPSSMRIVFAFPSSNYKSILEQCGMNITSEDIGGLYLHVTYENNEITIITATSLNIFVMDKSLDKYWDNLMTKFLGSHFDIETIS